MSNVNVGVAVLILADINNETPKILLGKRRAKKDGVFEIGDCYALPGGKMESTDESIHAAASRELLEELGFGLWKDNTHDYFVTYLANDKAAYVTFVIVFKVIHKSELDILVDYDVNGQKRNDEFESFALYELTDLPSPLFPPTKNALNIYMSGIDKNRQIKKGVRL